MELSEAPQIIEAILFVAGEPVKISDLAAALEMSEMETIHAVEEL
jgi:chromosome segregation and condensation protein ScpB